MQRKSLYFLQQQEFFDMIIFGRIIQPKVHKCFHHFYFKLFYYKHVLSTKKHTKNWKYFRWRGCQCHLKHEVPLPCSMWFYDLKHYKIDLKLIFLTCIINFRTWNVPCSTVYHDVTIDFYIFLESTPFQITYWVFLIRFIINYFLLFKFIQAFYTYIRTKDNFFILDNGVFDGFSRIFVRHWISVRLI